MKPVLLATGVAALACACTPAPQALPAPAATPSTTPSPATASTPAAVSAKTKPASDATAPRTWVLPGSLGPLTTRLQLESRFGKSNVVEETFPGAEGNGRYPALVVFPDDPRRRLELVLDAADPDAPIRELRVPSVGSLWHDVSGLRTGMSLAELVALNGAPVSFYGLGWDYGGTVQDWHGGRLANGVGETLFHRVTLAARSPATQGSLPLGDGSFRSDDRRWPNLGKDLVVAELGISWPNEGGD